MCLVAGVGGKLSRPVYLDPYPLGYQSKIILAKFSHFKLSECDDVSIINIIQVKFSCFLSPPTPATKHTEQSDKKKPAKFDLNYVYNWYMITFR